MWQGKYQKWNPVPHLENEYLNIRSIHHNWDGLRIWFSPEDKVIPIIIFKQPLMYVNSEENFRLLSVENSSEMDFSHLFWKLENSQLLSEFCRQSVDSYNNREITHYAFLSAFARLDVLSETDPIFEII